MIVEPSDSHREVYNLLYGCIVPRPIAWVTTLSQDGIVNAAPYSAFSVVSVLPPRIIVSCGIEHGKRKDTARNIAATGNFCINIVSLPLLEAMHASSAEYPPETSETSTLGLETAPSHKIAAPRIAAAPASLECELYQIHQFGPVQESFIGTVVAFNLQDGLYAGGHVDQRRLAAVGRIGGPTYVTPGEFITMPHPKI